MKAFKLLSVLVFLSIFVSSCSPDSADLDQKNKSQTEDISSAETFSPIPRKVGKRKSSI